MRNTDNGWLIAAGQNTPGQELFRSGKSARFVFSSRFLRCIGALLAWIKGYPYSRRIP